MLYRDSIVTENHCPLASTAADQPGYWGFFYSDYAETAREGGIQIQKVCKVFNIINSLTHNRTNEPVLPDVGSMRVSPG